MEHRESHMPYKSVLELFAVWTVTLTANAISFLSQWLEYLPIIREILGIVSLIVAIAYSLYKFGSNWNGYKPWRKRRNNKPKQ